MNKRTKNGQKKHGESVLKSAEWYKKHGFTTNADLPGWNKPKKIRGFIPDKAGPSIIKFWSKFYERD